MNRFLRTTIYISIIFISILSANAQTSKFVLEVLVTEDGRKLSNASVSVYKNGAKQETFKTDAKGKVDVVLDLDADYIVSFSSMGMITKKLKIDTRNVPPEDLGANFGFPAEVDIFQKIPDLDIKILDEPIGIIRYDPNMTNFDVDMAHTQRVKAQLEKLQKDYEAKKAAEAANAANAQKVYDDAIKKADKFFSSEQWKEAKAEYEIAAKAIPFETYPSFQIAELQSKLIKEEESDSKYNAAMTSAKKAFDSKDYQRAISEYKIAKSLKPSESEPSSKISEIESFLATQAKTEQAYLEAINSGDKALIVNNLEDAKIAFQKATELKPSESYPKNKLAEINDVMQKAAAKDKAYADAVSSGDQAIKDGDLVKAKSEFTKAQGIKPKETLPQEKLTQIESLMAEQAKKEQSYLAAIQKGDNALTANKFDEAKMAFQEASAFKPLEEYPKNKIKEIDDFIAKNAAKEKEYTDAIAAADKALGDKDYTTAKTNYEKANGLKPKESYPTQKIAEIEGIMAENAKKEQEYTASIANGDQALSSKEYEKAKAAFSKANGLKPDEKYPKDKLSEIESLLAELNKKNEDYQKAISEGDELLAASNYNEAKSSFESALALKPNESYPKTKISEIDGLVAKAAAKEKAYNDAISKADLNLKENKLEEAQVSYEAAIELKSNEQYPKDKVKEIKDLLAADAKKEQEYTAAITAADNSLKSKDYPTAKAQFETAKGIKPTETYPAEKLKEIERILAELAKKDADYNDAISKADAAFLAENYEEAKIDYNEALKIKANEKYPNDKIAEADNKIAAKQKKLEEIRIAKEKEVAAEKLYAETIVKADKLLVNKKFKEAISSYEEALKIKATESYPTEKIEEARTALAAIETLEKEYAAAIKSGDDALAAGNFNEAKNGYNAALALKGNEQYPKDKVAEADKLAADANAAALAKAEEEKKQAAYQEQIQKADAELANKQFETAIASYQKAKEIKSGEQYPTDKIKEAEELLAAAMGEKAAAEKAAKIEAEYQGLISQADADLAAKKYDAATDSYTKAKGVKPSETYPQQKLDEITALIGAQAAAEKEAKIQAEYQGLLADAENALKDTNYELAIEKFNNASGLKPNETYPKNKVNEIKALIEAHAAQNAAKEAAAELEANYNKLISDGDAAFQMENWEEAKTKYNSALALKEEEYPKSQVKLINSKLDQLAKKNEEIRLANEKNAKKDEEYEKLMADGNGLFSSGNFKEAIELYKAAQTVKPNEKLPQDQITLAESRIADLIKKEEERLAAEKNSYETKAKYLNIIAKADQSYAIEDYDLALEKYNEALAVMDEQYPKDQIKLITNRKDKEKEEAEANAKIDKEYKLAIETAIAAYDAKDYTNALASFKKASDLKDYEQLPKERIREIESILAKQAAEKDKALAARQRAQENELAFNSLIQSADNAFKNGDYKSAKSDYEGALNLKPRESYPEEQIRIIDSKLAQEKRENDAAAKALADQKRLEQQQKEKIVVTGKSEAEIEAMYKEMWANKSSKKAQAKKTEAELLAERRAKELEQDEAKRQAELLRLKKISVSLDENKPISSDRYLQNLETLNQQANAIDKVEEGRIVTAQRSREEKMMDLVDLQANISDNQEGYTYRTLTPNYEKVKALTDAKESQTEELTIEQQARILKTRENLVEIDQKIQSYRAELAKARLSKTANVPSDQAKSISDANSANLKEADQIIEANQQKILELVKQREEVQVKYNNDISQRGIEYSAEKAKFQVDYETEATLRNSAKSEIKATDFYTGEKRNRNDADLANKYPQGVTEEIIDGASNSTTIRRIVVEGTQVDIYEKTFYSWGAIFYNKNGVNIDEDTWKREAKK